MQPTTAAGLDERPVSLRLTPRVERHAISAAVASQGPRRSSMVPEFEATPSALSRRPHHPTPFAGSAALDTEFTGR